MNETQDDIGGFELAAPYAPSGGQPQAIDGLVASLAAGNRHQTLLGVTGSGKTFTMANVIQQAQRPALIMAHNKTLAAQLYSEFKGFFPNNAVEYFVSYYDYYQPEAYVPSKDLYIEKESSINEEVDKLRLSATRSLLSRRDVIIVATVSSIYGLGSPKSYEDLTVRIDRDQPLERDDLLAALVAIQYERGDISFERGRFRVRGDVVEIWPAYDDEVIRVELFGDEIEQISTVHALTGEVLGRHDRLNIYPAKHFVVDEPTLEQSIGQIREDLDIRYAELLNQQALVEAQRLKSRTLYDLEMLETVGYCPGIENYSRYLAGRPPEARPYCLFDFFPPDFICFVDESHVTVPQIGGMYQGDRARKETLVEHGFRLPSALDNRPMRFDEWEQLTPQAVYVSATPGPYEDKHEQHRSEQLVRPTGLVDPPIEVRPTEGQIDDLMQEVIARAQRGERSLVTTVTKKLAERVAEYFQEQGLRCAWLHSDLDTLERIEILRELRSGVVDCLVGVNLLREGLDLPEVSLVAVFDAEKEGFLRSSTSLIQIFGRAARHLDGQVICYADKVSPAMKAAFDECERRRQIQLAHNAAQGITPRSAVRRDDSADFQEQLAARRAAEGDQETEHYQVDSLDELRVKMREAAEALKFEEAARLRDVIKELESGDKSLVISQPGPKKQRKGKRRRR